MSGPALDLLAWQSALQAHLLGQAPAPAELLQTLQAGGIGRERRLAIYHHAYRARLLDTLRDTYGHTLRYLGDELFDAHAAAYVEAHPSATPSLRWYGLDFPAWLGVRWPEDGEIAELAALDQALRAAFDSADQPVLGLAELGALAPARWLAAPLLPQAGMALLQFRHNTLALWQALDDDATPPPACRLPEAGAVLVWRRGQQPHFRSVADAEAQALALLAQGCSFQGLCAALADGAPAQDAEALQATAAQAGAWLRRWVDEGLLVAWPDAA